MGVKHPSGDFAQSLHSAGTTLAEASLIGAQLPQTILHGADLTGACLRGAKLADVDMIGVNLTRTDASEIETEKLQLLETACQGLILRGAKLERSVFLQLDLSNSDFSGASMLMPYRSTCSSLRSRLRSSESCRAQNGHHDPR